MNAIGKLKITVAMIALVLVCGTVNAQHRRWHHHPRRMVTVVYRPVATSPVSNRFSQKERFAMQSLI